MKNIYTFILLCISLFPAISNAADRKTEAGEVYKGSNFLILVGSLEAEGKKGFHLTHENSENPISTQTLQLAGYNVEQEQYAFEKGIQTLLYRFIASREGEKREISVFYNGLLSLAAGGSGFYFYIAEEYQKSIRYYAMYNNEPSIDAVKAQVANALQNPDSALVATRWKGKEASIFIYDSTRLSD